jgi:hypothetical protein
MMVGVPVAISLLAVSGFVAGLIGFGLDAKPASAGARMLMVSNNLCWRYRCSLCVMLRNPSPAEYARTIGQAMGLNGGMGLAIANHRNAAARTLGLLHRC